MFNMRKSGRCGMATTTFQPNYNLFTGIRNFKRRMTARGLWFGLILLGALIAFEMFNFSTTEYALATLFGRQDALGVVTWAKVLAIAFCGIDFAGLSRLFTPETGRKEPKEIWLLTGAWLLGAGMNAIMTWWAVGSALSANQSLGNELLSRADILQYGPIFIAALVWLTRILIIGTFAFAGDHIFSTAYRARNGAVVDGVARPLNSAGRMAYPAAEPRAVPKPSQRPGLPERGMPLESSSYARGVDSNTAHRRYESQNNVFGHGAGTTRIGGTTFGGSHEPFRPAASQTGTPLAYSAAVDDVPRAQVETENPATRRDAFQASARSEVPVSEKPMWAGPRRASTPVRPAAFDRRASSTRTVNSAPPAEPAAAPSQAAPATMELEYVDIE
jgi:hypothetical protein